MSILNIDYVICNICHCKFRQITLPHLKLHNINISEYCIKFPDAVLACSNMSQKRKETNLERRGVEHHFQCKDIKRNIENTHLKNCGVRNPMQSKEIQDKSRLTNLKRYGVENSMQREEIQDKSKKTLFNHYGVEYPMQSKEIQNKKKATCINKYGTENFMQDAEIQNKKRITNFKKYGVEHVLQNEIFKIKLSCSSRGIEVKDFDGFISYNPYCEKFNKTKKKEVRDKYNNCDYLTGIHRDICNKDKSGKIRELDVHHVNYNKNQGCNGNKWILIPLSRSNHIKTNSNRIFWNRLFKYSLEIDKTYYNGVF